MTGMLIKSFVMHGDKCFLVSTINRTSSATLAYGSTYAETLVWEYDPEKQERGALVGQGEGLTDSIHRHLAMCKEIHETGLT